MLCSVWVVLFILQFKKNVLPLLKEQINKYMKKKGKKNHKSNDIVHDKQYWLALTAWEISNLIGLLSFSELMDMVVSQDHWVSISAGWAPVNNLSLSPLNAYR